MVGFVKYISIKENLLDMAYLGFGAANPIDHYTHSPFHIRGKLIFIAVIFLAMMRTFKFLRVIESFSPIVTMVLGVIYDMQAFLLFYFILCLLMSAIVGIIGVSNVYINNPLIPNLFYAIHWAPLDE